MMICAIGVVVVVCLVAQLVRCAPDSVDQTTSSPNLPAIDVVEEREIVCWGDSLTLGVGAGEAVIESGGETFDASYLAYPEILEMLTGLPTYNYGVEGATSAEIAYMQGGYMPESGREDWEHVDSVIMWRSAWHTGDILVLELGSNGGWDEGYEQLIEQYQYMLNYAECDDYIIIGDTDDPGLSPADLNDWPMDYGLGIQETAWEVALREAFGEHFVNMRLYLIEHGLEVAGLTPTEEDVRLVELGCVPEQLRSDWTHLNSFGYYAKAIAVYEKGQELGYWE